MRKGRVGQIRIYSGIRNKCGRELEEKESRKIPDIVRIAKSIARFVRKLDEEVDKMIRDQRLRKE